MANNPGAPDSKSPMKADVAFNPLEARRLARMHKDESIMARMVLELDSALKESQRYAVELERRCEYLRLSADESQKYTSLYGRRLVQLQYELDARERHESTPFLHIRETDAAEGWEIIFAEAKGAFPVFRKFDKDTLVPPPSPIDCDLTCDDGGLQVRDTEQQKETRVLWDPPEDHKA